MGPVSFENVEEQEVDGKIYIENKEVGLIFSVPDGWETEKSDIGLSMRSSDFISVEEAFFIPKSGCRIDIVVERQKEGSDYDMQYTNLKQLINDKDMLASRNTDKEKCEIVDMSGLMGARDDLSIDSNVNNLGNRIYVAIPYNNVIYRFETYIFGQDKEKCLQDFDNFLTTVFIKKK